MDVTPQQQKWIVDHVGHTLDVHNIHYRSTSDMKEGADIAKLLMLMNRKQVGYFKNKMLEESSLGVKISNCFMLHHAENH